MNKTPSISVIVPVYNTPAWMLEECLCSIASQSLAPCELVLVDDGSTDEATLFAERDFCEAHPGLVKPINGGHGGISHALNTGLAAANGDFVCFFASDDYLKPDFLEKLAAAAERAGADVSFCGYEYVSHRGERVMFTTPEIEVFSRPERFLYAMRGWNFQLYRRRFLLDKGCRFPEGCIMEDEVFTDFAFTLSNNTVAVPKYLCCVRDRDDSVSRSRRKFNSATIDNLPFDEFERCLNATKDEPKERREALAYRVMHSMMTASFLFCCYSEKATRREVVSRAASLVRAHDWSWCDFGRVHRGIGDKGWHYLMIKLYRFSLGIRAEQAFSAFFCALSRLVYRLRGLD